MAGIQRVVGTEFDGTSVTTTFGRHPIKATKAAYKDSLEVEKLSSMGSQGQDAMTAGTYKTDQVSLTFRSSVFRSQLMPLFPTNGGGNIPVQIVVSFSNPQIGSDSDLLENCRCVNWAAACEASNKGLEVETMWETLQIRWTSDRKTLNALNGAVPNGASTFG